jgi:formate-dependent phosphoribosylglycinamide formyltransferase (GAR transformylase)
MVHFTRGLADVGAQVIGVGDQPQASLDPVARHSLAAYVQVESLWDEAAFVEEVRRKLRGVRLDRVECLWEPGMLLAARLRESLGVPGMTLEQTVPFRDKERMKQALDAAGIRTPHHFRAATASAVREAASRVGFPLIVKPIAGAGSADTHRVNDAEELEAVLPALRHVPEVSVEEFIDGEEFTFDTICADGEILYHNISWYRPRPLIGRTVQWISPQTITLRNPGTEELRVGREMGAAVLRALGFRTGFTHMEWFRKPGGEAVFGEIGARPPGARSVYTMNYACDLDTFSGWAEAVCHGRLSQPIERRYNCAVIFKRAQGEGRIQRIEGLERILARLGEHIVHLDLLPLGAARRNWKQTLISDGYIILRHPDLMTTLEMADAVGTDLQMYAG